MEVSGVTQKIARQTLCVDKTKVLCIH